MSSSRRDDFPPATKLALAQRAGYRCSFLNCDAQTIGPSDDAPDATNNVGAACHICAAAPDGPRYDAAMSSEQRSSIHNGIWMCRTHGTVIDNDEKTYPVALLKQWKSAAEARAKDRLGAMEMTANRRGSTWIESTAAVLSERTTSHDPSSVLAGRNARPTGGRDLTAVATPLITPPLAPAYAIERPAVLEDLLRDGQVARPLVGTVHAQHAIVAGQIDTLHVHNHPGARYPGWTRILFEEQDDLLAALAGESLGPRHVEACPRVPAVRDLVERLHLSGGAALVGDSGSGKSMVAWHAAFDLHREGWHVYLLTNPIAAAGELPEAEPRALLVVDDAQALPALPLTPALISPRRAMLVVSTMEVPGFRGVVRVDPRRSVESLAAAFRERGDDLLPLVRRLDSSVGEGFLDTSIQRQIDWAARSSTLPWQFMFNLGSGHLRLRAKLAALHETPPLDGILFALACYQLASRDSPCPLDWLGTIAERHLGTDARDVPEFVKAIDEKIRLVRTPRQVSAPHARVAALILDEMFYGEDQAAHARRDILWSLFADRSLPVAGISWLLSNLPHYVRFVSGLPSAALSAVVDRAFSSDDHGHSGFVLGQLAATRSFDLSTISERIRDIASWIEHATLDEAPGLASLVNSLITRNRTLATNLVGLVTPGHVAAKMNAATPGDGFLVGGLIDRLAFAAPKAWLEEVGRLLDRDALKRSFSNCRPEEVASASPFVWHIWPFDSALPLELARCMSPAIIGGLSVDPVSGFLAAQDVFWWALGFAPEFFRDGHEPETEQKALAAQILTAVGPAVFRERINRARRPDWDALQYVSALLREVVPDLASLVGSGIRMEPLIEDLARLLQASPHEFDAALGSLALGGDCQPARRLIEVLRPRVDRLTIKAAFIAPAAAAELALAGGAISLGLGGGLPSWRFATVALLLLHRASPQAAKIVLRANQSELADGFAYRQANGGDGAARFLRVATAIDREILLDAMRSVDVNLARPCWSDRAKGGSNERAVLRAFLSLAQEAGGPASELATAIQVLVEP